MERPTLTLIRCQPSRAAGAGIVLDPVAIDRKPTPRSATAALAESTTSHAARAMREWIDECHEEWSAKDRPELERRLTRMVSSLNAELREARRSVARRTRPDSIERARKHVADLEEMLADTERRLAAGDFAREPVSTALWGPVTPSDDHTPYWHLLRVSVRPHDTQEQAMAVEFVLHNAIGEPVVRATVAGADRTLQAAVACAFDGLKQLLPSGTVLRRLH